MQKSRIQTRRRIMMVAVCLTLSWFVASAWIFGGDRSDRHFYSMLIATIACSTVARVVWRFCVSPSIAKLANGRICKAASDLRLRRNTRPTGGDSVFHSYGGSGTSHDYIGSDCFNNFGPLYFCRWTTPITWSVTKRCSIESPAGAKLFVVN